MLDTNLYEEHKSTVTSSKLLIFLDDFVVIKTFYNIFEGICNLQVY